MGCYTGDIAAMGLISSFMHLETDPAKKVLRQPTPDCWCTAAASTASQSGVAARLQFWRFTASSYRRLDFRG
jgi:hypothetical protein